MSDRLRKIAWWTLKIMQAPGLMHRISHWLNWTPCELVKIVHTYYRGTRTMCEGFCFLSKGQPQCEWYAIIRCRVCGKEWKV